MSIVDFHNGNFTAFDGVNYDNIKQQNITYGQNITTNNYEINTFLCIIHFSSKYTYTIPGKKDIIRKESTSLIRYFPKILTKTKLITNKKDMYAIIKIEKVEDNIMYCDVCSYLGEIENIIALACTAHWKQSKKFILEFSQIHNIDLTPKRDDYSDREIYSIDPEGCRDIDDALHCHYNNDIYEIGIHIADTSSYIEEESIFDKELQQRTETVYTIPPNHMIPEELSIQHISLLEGSKKRAFSVIIKLDSNINIISVDFKKSYIMVTKNLTYDEAQNMINTNDTMKKLFEIGLVLQNKLSKIENYESHQMVATYMIYANKFVGEKIQNYDPDNVLLRVHTGTKNNIVHNAPPMLLKKYEISLMEQAKYQISVKNCEHYGLNLQYYTHFTSPMRRYADIIVHRQLYNVLNKEKLQKVSANVVFLINFYKKYYKQMERYSHTVNIADILKEDFKLCDAYVTFIDTEKEAIRLYIPEFELDYEYFLINEKVRDIYNIEILEDYVIIKNIQTNKTVDIKLFQKVNVKIIASRNNFVKLRVEIFYDA